MSGPSDTRSFTDMNRRVLKKSSNLLVCASKIADFGNGHGYDTHDEESSMYALDIKSQATELHCRRRKEFGTKIQSFIWASQD
jgi:hypothetical protein